LSSIASQRSLKTTRTPDSSTHSTLIEDVTPINQAGFRQHRSCTEQVMALTTHIEASFQHQLKTGAVFVDLTAAYDTVWREGLMIKFLAAVPCLKLFKLFESLLPGFSWRPK
jgi:hypothetical protein